MKLQKLRISGAAPLLLLSVVFLLAGSYAGLGIWSILKYIAAQIFIVFLSGLFLFYVSKLKVKNTYQVVFWSYALGYCIWILIYFIFLILGIQKYIAVFGWLIGIINAVVFFTIFKQYRQQLEYEAPSGISMVYVLVVLLVGCIIMFFTMQLNNEPATVGYSNIDQDLAYWVRHSLDATLGYPIPNLGMLGKFYYNHYFTNLEIAFLYYTTGIDLYTLSFSFNEYVIFFLLLGSTYSLFMEFVSEKWALLCSGILLFCAPVQNHVYIFYIAHMYIGSHGTAEGYAMCMFAFLAFYKMIFRGEAVNKPGYCIPFFLYAVTLGLKGPIGVVILAGIGLGCIILVIQKEDRSKGLISGVSYLALTVLVMLFVLRGPEIEDMVKGTHYSALHFSLTGTLLKADAMKNLYQRCLSVFPPALAYCLTMLCYIAESAFTINFFLIAAGYRGVVYLKENQKKAISFFSRHALIPLCLLIYLSAYILFLFLSHASFSQTYFIFAGYPFGLLAAVYVLNKDSKQFYEKRKWLFALQILLVIIALKPTIGSFTPYFISAPQRLRREFPDRPLTGSSLSIEELEGLLWIKDNIDADAVLITNKTFTWSVSYVTSFYTEHQMYIEDNMHAGDRRDLVSDYFTGELDDPQKLIDVGVDYAVVYENIPGYVSPAFGTEVFDNGAIRVLKIKE